MCHFPIIPSFLFSKAPPFINRRPPLCIWQVQINRRRVTLHKYCVSLSECYFLSLGLILMRMKLSSGGLPLILMVTTHQVAWTSLSFSISFLLPFSFIFAFHFIFIVSVFLHCIALSFCLYQLSFASIFTISCLLIFAFVKWTFTST